MTSQPIKYAFGLSLKILLTILLSFLFLEFLLLVFNDLVFRNSLEMYDPDLGYRARPYFRWGNNITNEFGFNDHDYSHERKPNTFRILILSDSFNWAGGLEGNYTALLERKFETHFGDQRVEIISAGYSGTHTGQQLEILKKFGLQYNPDLVVLGFFVGNDFLDALPWVRRIVVGSVIVNYSTKNGPEMTLFGQPLILKSRLLLFLNQERVKSRNLWIAQTLASTEPVEGLAMPTAGYLGVEAKRMQVANWAMLAEIQPREDYIFNRLLTMHDLLAERKIEFMVVAYPDEFQVDESLRQAVIDKFDLDVSTYQWDRPQSRLWQFCTDHNIVLHDMLPTFLEMSPQGQHLYLPNDSHWNKAGNELAAEYMFNLLLPKAQEYLLSHLTQ